MGPSTYLLTISYHLYLPSIFRIACKVFLFFYAVAMSAFFYAVVMSAQLIFHKPWRIIPNKNRYILLRFITDNSTIYYREMTPEFSTYIPDFEWEHISAVLNIFHPRKNQLTPGKGYFNWLNFLLNLTHRIHITIIILQAWRNTNLQHERAGFRTNNQYLKD